MKTILLLILTIFVSSIYANVIRDFEATTPEGSWSKKTVFEKMIKDDSKFKKISETTFIFEKKETDGVKTFYWIEVQTQHFSPRRYSEYLLVKVDPEKFAKLHMRNVSFFTDPNYIFTVPDMVKEVYSSANGTSYKKEDVKRMRDKVYQFKVIVTSIKKDKDHLVLSSKKVPTDKHTYTTDTVFNPGSATRLLLKNPDTKQQSKRALKREHTIHFSDKYPFRFVKAIEKEINNPNKGILIKAGMKMGSIPDQRKQIITNLSAFGFTGKKSKIMPLLKGQY